MGNAEPLWYTGSDLEYRCESLPIELYEALMDASMKRFGMLSVYNNELQRLMTAYDSSHSLSLPIRLGESEFAEPIPKGLAYTFNAIKRVLYRLGILRFTVAASYSSETDDFLRIRFNPATNVGSFVVAANDWLPFINVLMQAKAFVSKPQQKCFLDFKPGQRFAKEDAKHAAEQIEKLLEFVSDREMIVLDYDLCDGNHIRYEIRRSKIAEFCHFCRRSDGFAISFETIEDEQNDAFKPDLRGFPDR
jgi:hypothetical protein